MMCEKQELLITYLYDEVSAEDRQAWDAHLRECAECRDELEGLRSTRGHLALWAPPEPDLGFRVIRGGAAPAPALPRRMRFAPAFAFAAAAVVVLAVAAAIANIEIRYGSDGMVVRTGWARADAQPAVQTAATPTAGGPDAAADFTALNRRLDQLESALASQPAGSAATQASDRTGMADTEMLRRVREIVSEAESRQRVTMAQVLLQAVNDFERQRRIDLAALQQGIGNERALTNAEMAQTRDIVNHLMRVATKQEK